jgi:HAD superfamily hydrolase (TIGR01509 family)
MKAYIFDLDGTLLDSMDVWHRIDTDFLHKRGIAVPSDYANAISAMTFFEIAAYTIKRFNLPDSIDSLMREWMDMAAYAYRHTVALKPYAKEYLSALRERGVKLGIATSLSAELHELALRNHEINDWFQAICTTDEAGQGKTQPDVFLLCAKKLGVQPSSCLVFDDILDAVKSAKRAGMKVCAVYDASSDSDWETMQKIADYAILDFQNAPLN